jgi:hypothetical protein
VRSFLLLALCLPLAACDGWERGPKDPVLDGKMVPDRTVLIASHLDASPEDSLYNLPAEVYVAYATASGGTYDEQYRIVSDPDAFPGVYAIELPSLNAFVMETSYKAGLRYEPEPDAVVTLTGPIGGAGEQTVTLAHQGAGRYNDGRRLSREAEATYRLNVTLPDGRAYASETTLPGTPQGELPEYYELPVRWWEWPDGIRGESNTSTDDQMSNSLAPFLPTFTFHGNTTTRQVKLNKNRIFSRELMEVREEGHMLRFEDKGPHFWETAVFTETVGDHIDLADMIVWSTSDTRKTFFEASCLYYRITDMNPDMLRAYQLEGLGYANDPSDDAFDLQQRAMRSAFTRRDTSYLFDESNIYLAGSDGRPDTSRPSRAIGVFGGTASRYLTTWIFPIRTWDPFGPGWDWPRIATPEQECDLPVPKPTRSAL